MNTQAPVIVQNHDGLLGVLEDPNALQVGSEARIAVRLTSGKVVLVPVDLMVQQFDGSFHLDLTADAVDHLETAKTETETKTKAARKTKAATRTRQVGDIDNAAEAVVIPVIAESVEVEKRLVEQGRVQIQKTVATHDEVVRDSLVVDAVEVERVPVNRVVDGPVGNRQDGETLVVPVYKEVLVVEKRLMLVEEIRITRRQTEQPFSQAVPLRTESVAVDRSSAAGGESEEE